MPPRDKLPKTWNPELQTVNYWSPSSIARGNPDEYGGCLARAHFVTVQGKKEPFTAQQKTGVDGHTQAENYYLTGQAAFSPFMAAGLEHMPEPNGKQIVECRIHRVKPGETPQSKKVFDGSDLLIEGVPVVGYMDLEDLSNPLIPRVYDWKTTKDLKYAKIDPENTTQMLCYGQYILDKTQAEQVGIHHVYFQTRTPYKAKPTGRVVDIEHISKGMAKVTQACREILDVFRETDYSKIPANTNSCKAWGGCPHQSYCTVSKNKSLADFLGLDSVAELKQGIEIKEKATMGDILDDLENDVNSEIAAIEAEDKAADAVEVPAGFKAAWESISIANKGTPTLTGEALTVYLAMTGEKLGKGETELKGTGQMAQLKADTSKFIFELSAKILEKYGAEGAQAGAEPKKAEPAKEPVKEAPALLSPDAPPRDSGSVKAEETKPEPVKAPEVKQDGIEKAEKPATSFSLTPSEFNKLNKPQMKEEYELLYNFTKEATSEVTESVTVNVSGGLRLYVNCIPSEDFKPLAPIVNNICDEICERLGTQDLRLGDHKHTEFGKYKGLLAAAVKELRPDDGAYYIDTRGNEIYEIAAAALASIADYSVRGV